MASRRHDREGRGVIFEPLFRWLQDGQPDDEEAYGMHYSAAAWWLIWWGTGHWHPCSYCGEGRPERLLRLLSIAIDQGLVGLSGDPGVMLDDDQTRQIIAALDSIEAPPSWEWFSRRYTECPARKNEKSNFADFAAIVSHGSQKRRSGESLPPCSACGTWFQYVPDSD
jgi:hypothetical protein